MAGKGLLLRILTTAGTSADLRIFLTVHDAPSLLQPIAQDFTMITTITGVLIVLSIGILIAHALDAFRS
jgi:hypothetical protein